MDSHRKPEKYGISIRFRLEPTRNRKDKQKRFIQSKPKKGLFSKNRAIQAHKLFERIGKKILLLK